ncbi:hypothetical protein SmJEL517_g01689 [Synchytrium microbalum]|uniref:1-phosphatidylinositol-3-phosphate 5-kinase n=1 Tax=Synchytrium microbalum TaxID=1806994 RepID=A0A507C8V9_9FUNG|nr:uncharacterized protein SmJEL517_g01689 [Synchytrium microbalum]TPX35961.1 hypothetical protein SmJEL517_g01689 [Synchytrium microbalum]
MLSLFNTTSDKKDSALDLSKDHDLEHRKSDKNNVLMLNRHYIVVYRIGLLPLPSAPFVARKPLPLPPGLDSASVEHLNKIIQQCLHEAHLEYEPWGPVLARLGLEIADGAGSALKIVGRSGVDGEVYERAAHFGPRDSKEQSRPKVARVPIHHIIQVETIPTGTPQDSRFLKGSSNEESGRHGTLVAVPHLRDLGGVCKLRGDPKEIAKVARIMELVAFIAVHLKLEMCLLHDHGSVRMGNPETLQDDHPPSRSGTIGSNLTAAIKMVKKNHDTPSNSNNNSSSQSRTSTNSSAVWNIFAKEGKSRSGTLKSLPEDEHFDISNRFDRVIRQIEKTTLSISPDVQFPPPHLLVRLRDEEAATDEHHRPKSYAESDVEPLSDASVFGKRFRSWGKDADRSSVASATTITTQDVKRLSTAIKTSLSSAEKSGLGYLTTNNNSLAGIVQHQSLAYSYTLYRSSSSTIPCQPPVVRICEYYKKEQSNTLDLTIGQQIDLWLRTVHDPCPDITCRLTMSQHQHRFTHGSVRVTASILEDDSVMPKDSQFQVYAWTECTMCGWRNVAAPISTATWKYSFGKYLELMIYHPSFVPQGGCNHVTSDKRAPRRCFRHGRYTISLIADPISLYEMRVPKIQVMPSHLCPPPQELTQQTSWTISEQAEITDKLRMEIAYFYGSVKDVVKMLEQHTGAAAVRMNKGTPVQVRMQVGLDEMSRDFRDEELGLTEQLTRIVPSAANNLRRRFVKIADATVGRLDDWRIRNAPSVAISDCLLPEYMSAKGVFLFPNSCIVVRLEEPSSIIAMALNSREYLREVGIWRNAKAFGAGAAANGVLWDVTAGDCHFKLKAFSHEGPDAPRVHVKHKFSDGKNSFSCAIYFAFQFEELRRRCGFDISYVKSLVRCNSWRAEGGKSKVGFFKTMDDQLVIKQLTTNWTTVEKDGLLKFAPNYFEYMSNSDKNPTSLAKIFGFYTLKHKNEVTGVVTRMDLLVMEHVFCNIKVSRTFDLKGIPDRLAPANDNPKKHDERTMYDQDWIDGRYQSLLMIHSHSKRLIMDSVKNDTAFLASCNVMDYSLLVGVNDERRELVVGIVDFIGRYTTFKHLENQTKTALKQASLRNLTIGRVGLGTKDAENSVTVLPPLQYKERFERAMEQYFVMVPDKWIRIQSGSEPMSSSSGPVPPVPPLPSSSTNNNNVPRLPPRAPNRLPPFVELHVMHPRRSHNGGVSTQRTSPYQKPAGRNGGPQPQSDFISRVTTKNAPQQRVTFTNHAAAPSSHIQMSSLFTNHKVTEVRQVHVRAVAAPTRMAAPQQHHNQSSSITARLSGPSVQQMQQIPSTRAPLPPRPQSTIQSREVLDLTDEDEQMEDVVEILHQPTAATTSVSIKGQSNGPTTITIKNLHLEATEADVKACFMDFGTITKTTLSKDQAGQSTGTAQIMFKERSAALAAIAKYNGQFADGNLLEVFETKPSTGVVGASRRTSEMDVTPSSSAAPSPVIPTVPLLNPVRPGLPPGVTRPRVPPRASKVPVGSMYADREEEATAKKAAGGMRIFQGAINATTAVPVPMIAPTMAVFASVPAFQPPQPIRTALVQAVTATRYPSPRDVVITSRIAGRR